MTRIQIVMLALLAGTFCVNDGRTQERSVPQAALQAGEQESGGSAGRPAARSRILQRYDKDGDGKLNEAERTALEKARAMRNGGQSRKRFDGAEGDTSTSKSRMPAVAIPESVSPVHTIEVKSADGEVNPLAYRLPPGEGPFPAVIFFHGGTGHQSAETVAGSSLAGPVRTRFLEKGYAIAVATRREIRMDQDRTFKLEDGSVSHSGKALLDCIAAVDAVKKLPEIDSESVVIYAGSAGAALAIDTASHVELAAVAAGEPASHLFIGAGRGEMKLSSESQKHLESTLTRIDCPILILHGDKPSGLLTINRGPVMKTLRKLGKQAEMETFPGRSHGFYWGTGRGNQDMTIADLEAVIETADVFFKKHLGTQPSPIAETQGKGQ